MKIGRVVIPGGDDDAREGHFSLTSEGRGGYEGMSKQ